MTMCSKFNLIVTALATSAILFVSGAANAGSHPGGAAQPTTATMGGHGTGGSGGRGPGCNYRGSGGCPPLPLGHVSGTNKQTCKLNGEGCLRPK
jgi:hypothetical protein